MRRDVIDFHFNRLTVPRSTILHNERRRSKTQKALEWHPFKREKLETAYNTDTLRIFFFNIKKPSRNPNSTSSPKWQNQIKLQSTHTCLNQVVSELSYSLFCLFLLLSEARSETFRRKAAMHTLKHWLRKTSSSNASQLQMSPDFKPKP